MHGATKNTNLRALMIGMFIWVVFAIFSNKIADLVIYKGIYKYYPIFSVWSYLLIVSFGAALIAGRIGRARGWVLGLILQGTITLGLIIFFLFSPNVKEDIKARDITFISAFFNNILKQIPWLMAAMIGGHLGEKTKKGN